MFMYAANANHIISRQWSEKEKKVTSSIWCRNPVVQTEANFAPSKNSMVFFSASADRIWNIRIELIFIIHVFNGYFGVECRNTPNSSSADTLATPITPEKHASCWLIRCGLVIRFAWHFNESIFPFLFLFGSGFSFLSNLIRWFGLNSIWIFFSTFQVSGGDHHQYC